MVALAKQNVVEASPAHNYFLAKQLRNKKEIHTSTTATATPIRESNKPDVSKPTVGPLNDFIRDYTDEPHASRRTEILKKYPEIKELFGPDPITKYVALGLVAIQFSCALYIKDDMWSLKFWLLVYFVGATVNHSIFLAIHEISHLLAFKSVLANKILATITNIPIGLPYAAGFRGYHLEHHRYMGIENVDTDQPTELETKIFKGIFGKLFFCTFQIIFYGEFKFFFLFFFLHFFLFYFVIIYLIPTLKSVLKNNVTLTYSLVLIFLLAVRPTIIRPQKLSTWHYVNVVFEAFAMILLTYFYGPNPWLYFLTCSFVSGSLHPMAGHFLAEHFVFWDSHGTYSYYGPLNMFVLFFFFFFKNIFFHFFFFFFFFFFLIIFFFFFFFFFFYFFF